MSYKVIFDGFDTEAQAKAFASWYEGQGEQDSADWLQEHGGLNAAHVDLEKYHAQDGFIANNNQEIVVPLKLFYE